MKTVKRINNRPITSPLAFTMRPKVAADFIGILSLKKKYPFLSLCPLPSLIIDGPPGSGKTSLAHLLAAESHQEIYECSAVLSGVSDLKNLIERCSEAHQQQLSFNPSALRSIIFIDEIHRFNKAQQDALLPSVEKGLITMIGATTANPKFSINSALLSRTYLLTLPPHPLSHLIEMGLKSLNREYPPFPGEEKIVGHLAKYADGDARKMLNQMEIYLSQRESMIQEGLKESIDDDQKREQILKSILELSYRRYDRAEDRHYDTISAFIKSLRGSDPSSALLYLVTMLDGGEDPLFIARRMVIFASEDIGNADPLALLVANATLEAIKNIGLPEAKINMAHAVTYLASAPKSNASYLALKAAEEYYQNHPGTNHPPLHLKNGSPDYLYPHDFPKHFVKQAYTSRPIPNFYRPTEMGRERFLKEWLNALNHDI